LMTKASPGKPSTLFLCFHFFPRHARRAQCTAGTTAPPVATAGWLRCLQVNPPPFSFVFTSSLAMQDVHSARLCRRGEAGYCAHPFGHGPAHLKKNKKYLFQNFTNFPRSFYVFLSNIG
jgi:hypothetical protein